MGLPSVKTLACPMQMGMWKTKWILPVLPTEKARITHGYANRLHAAPSPDCPATAKALAASGLPHTHAKPLCRNAFLAFSLTFTVLLRKFYGCMHTPYPARFPPPKPCGKHYGISPYCLWIFCVKQVETSHPTPIFSPLAEVYGVLWIGTPTPSDPVRSRSVLVCTARIPLVYGERLGWINWLCYPALHRQRSVTL